MAKFKLFGKEGFFAKLGRRNLIIIGAIIAVGAAVWINYAVFYSPSQDVGYGDKNPSSDVGASEDENNAGDVRDEMSDELKRFYREFGMEFHVIAGATYAERLAKAVECVEQHLAYGG